MRARLRGEGGHVFEFDLPLRKVFADQVKAKKLVPADEETYEAVAHLLVEQRVPTREEQIRDRRGNLELADDLDSEADGTPPELDQQDGTEAAIAAAAARSELLDQVTEGAVTLEEVFTQVDDEDEHHVIGHTHLRTLLLAFPGIGDVHADEILQELGIDRGEHIDVLGVNQRVEFADLVAQRVGGGGEESGGAGAGEPEPEKPAGPKWPETHAKLDELATRLNVKWPEPAAGKKKLTVDEKIAALERAGKKPPKQ